MKKDNGHIVIFKTEDGKISVDARFDSETVWLSLDQMAVLFERDKSTISRHIKNVFEEGELQPESTVAKFATVQMEGDRLVERQVDFYNLDVIISVGYRVKSQRGTQFRIWATKRLNEYIRKGFTLDDERLKSGVGRYFRELLQRVRDIRSSERNLYQQVTDIYATAIDYDSSAEITQRFFSTVQNKMHYAAHQHTAAEIIYDRVDANKPFVGMTSFKGDYVTKEDVSVAKNYLTELELAQLNRMVTAYLDFAENMAIRKIPLTMADWEQRLNAFIEMFEYGLLKDAGKVTAEIAKLHAETEFEKYRIIQDRQFLSDYDKFLLELEEQTRKNSKFTEGKE